MVLTKPQYRNHASEDDLEESWHVAVNRDEDADVTHFDYIKAHCDGEAELERKNSDVSQCRTGYTLRKNVLQSTFFGASGCHKQIY